MLSVHAGGQAQGRDPSAHVVPQGQAGAARSPSDPAILYGRSDCISGNSCHSERAQFSLGARRLEAITCLCDGLKPKGNFLGPSCHPWEKAGTGERQTGL